MTIQKRFGPTPFSLLFLFLVLAAGVGAKKANAQTRGEGERDMMPTPIKSNEITERLIETYKETGRARTLQQGSVVVYPYGESTPIVTCAPLRICVMELEEGERVLSITAGDSQRWVIEESVSGPGGNTPLIMMKPMTWNVSTNMVVSTNERVYSVTLDSPPRRPDADEKNPSQAYTERVSFYYPREIVDNEARQRELERMRAEARNAEAEQRRNEPTPSERTDAVMLGREGIGSTVRGPQRGYEERSVYGGGQVTQSQLEKVAGVTVDDLFFDYSWEDKDDNFPWEPKEVFDDGLHTYIKVPNLASNGGEMPLLFGVTRTGETMYINYAMRNDMMITDRVLNKAIMVIGVEERGGLFGLGEKERVQSKLTITRDEEY